jgi:biotin transport system substrate-specific component
MLKTRPNTAMKRIADLTSLIVVHIGCLRLLLESQDGHDANEGPNMQALHPNVITGVTLPRRAVTTAVLIVGFALVTAAAAQVRIPLPGTPIAITGQTFGVLLAGAALGSRAGAGSMLLYVSLGAIGLPFFAGGEGGWTYATGASFGYLIGFVVAAWLIGLFAEQGRDRVVQTAVPAFLLGSAAIYTLGVTWLWATVEAIPTFGDALRAGMYPFIAGDVVKAVAAGLLLPAAWYVVEKANR